MSDTTTETPERTAEADGIEKTGIELQPGEEGWIENDGSGQALPPIVEGKQLFDDSDYEREALALPKVDGQQIDKIAVHFTGRVLLDRSNEHDVALFRKLMLGKDVELRVAGRVKGKNGGFTTNREGDLDAVVAEAKIDVGTVWVLTPDQL